MHGQALWQLGLGFRERQKTRNASRANVAGLVPQMNRRY